MAILIATENEVYKKGLYTLRVASIEPKDSVVTDKNGVTKDSTYLRWTFDILKRGFEGKTISANSSTAFGPGSKTRKWAEALLDRQFHVNEPVDTDDLIGYTATASIGIIKKGEAQYNEIEALTPIEQDEAPPQATQRTQRTAQPQQRPTVPRRQIEDFPTDEEIDFPDE